MLEILCAGISITDFHVHAQGGYGPTVMVANISHVRYDTLSHYMHYHWSSVVESGSLYWPQNRKCVVGGRDRGPIGGSKTADYL